MTVANKVNRRWGLRRRQDSGRTAWETTWSSAKFRTSDGTELHVCDSAAGATGAPVTLIMLHGWTLDHTSWSPVLAELDVPVRVLRYDHRGHGESGPAPEGTATIAQLADDLAELIEQRVPTGQIVLAGHSMGGMTVLALAERHPHLLNRVHSIALVASSAGQMSQLTLGLPAWAAAVFFFCERLANRGLAKLKRAHLLNKRTEVARPVLRWLAFGKGASRHAVAETAAQLGACHPSSMVSFRNSINEHERWHVLERLTGHQVAIVAGGVDRLTPARMSRRMAEGLPGASLSVYPDAGHMLTYERTSEVAAAVARLVASASVAPQRRQAG